MQGTPELRNQRDGSVAHCKALRGTAPVTIALNETPKPIPLIQNYRQDRDGEIVIERLENSGNPSIERMRDLEKLRQNWD